MRHLAYAILALIVVYVADQRDGAREDLRQIRSEFELSQAEWRKAAVMEFTQTPDRICFRDLSWSEVCCRVESEKPWLEQPPLSQPSPSL